MQRPDPHTNTLAACDLRAALAPLQIGPSALFQRKSGFSPDAACADFACHHAGLPARPNILDEPAVIYQQPDGIDLLLGLYGSENRLRAWCPALAGDTLPNAAQRLHPIPPTHSDTDHQIWPTSSLDAMPIPQSSPRDAGPYITMGFVMAGHSGIDLALSAHRMLVLGDSTLGISMLSSRHLRKMAQAAWDQGRDLPISINIGVPPAVAIASAAATAHLPDDFDKLSLAGALAQAPITIAHGPSPFLAQSEITLHGQLTQNTCAETHGDRPLGVTMPEFLGYDGHAAAPLNIIQVTQISQRPDAVFQATLGPGCEQSAILGLGGALALSLALKADDLLHQIADLRFSPSGGGMLLLFVALKAGTDDIDKDALARRLICVMPFTKTIIFVDVDVDIQVEADVFWAMTTRCNLAQDTHDLPGFPPLQMDPSQNAPWHQAGRSRACRSWIDATVPTQLHGSMTRSFTA